MATQLVKDQREPDMRDELAKPEVLLPEMVYVRHPWYERHNTLFAFPALDEIKSPGDTIRGIHHRTILTACGIITGNRFDDVHLSHDAYGERGVATPCHGLLRPGDYYLQVKGSLLPKKRSTTGTICSSITPSSSLLTAFLLTDHPYPIVPSFTDWEFPHGKVPPEWQSGNRIPPPKVDRCIITAAHVIPVDDAHIIPTGFEDWYYDNVMSRSIRNRVIDDGYDGKLTVDSELNMMKLRTDFHWLFNKCLFVIVPKPLSISPDSCPELPPAAETQQQSPEAVPTHQQSPEAEVPEIRFAVHFLDHRYISRYIRQYHNVGVQRADLDLINLDFLFARFALALFPYLYVFLHSGDKRYLSIVSVDKKTGVRSRQATWVSEGLINRKKRTHDQIIKGEEFNGYEQDDDGRWRLRNPIRSTVFLESDSKSDLEFDSQSDSESDSQSDSESDSQSDSESDSEGSDRGKPRQRVM
ncbi:hypothetical protein EV127DRAFT_490176 [Xylaria flabelliformis]|nr:hypothetical protein EV127DRAFT_490176 [Xylaria flabelliformis]